MRRRTSFAFELPTGSAFCLGSHRPNLPVPLTGAEASTEYRKV